MLGYLLSAFIMYSIVFASGQKMMKCEGDGVVSTTPMELYDKVTAQGDTVRALKTAKADKVSIVIPRS